MFMICNVHIGSDLQFKVKYLVLIVVGYTTVCAANQSVPSNSLKWCYL